MTKRSAESALHWEVPQKKCFRSFSKREMQLAAVQVAQNPSAHPSVTTFTGQRRGKRTSCSEDHESKAILSSPKKVPSTNGSESLDATEHVSSSGRFQDASRMFVEQPSCPHELASKRSKTGTQAKSEQFAKVMHTGDDEVGDGDLCAFNSFQFWRAPLPVLDLSLLDSVSSSEINGKASPKDPTEAMET